MKRLVKPDNMYSKCRPGLYWLLLAVVVVIGMDFTSCTASPKTAYSPALIRLQGATDVSYDVYKGRRRLMYTLDEEFPATLSLARIRARLRTMGWRPEAPYTLRILEPKGNIYFTIHTGKRRD
jgi:hypothetical protein